MKSKIPPTKVYEKPPLYRANYSKEMLMNQYVVCGNNICKNRA